MEEIPAYLPDGQGDHLYLWLQKTDLAAGDLLTRLSKRLGVAARDIGVAGQKDRRAVTRQFVSVPRQCASQLDSFQDDQIQILSVSAHGNKLRTGHLNGNRFRIVLRPTGDNMPFTAEHAAATDTRLQQLATDGFPNIFGAQRFGHSGRTALDGIAFLSGRITAGHWKPAQRRFMTKMVASAAQAAVFNLCLSRRTEAHTCGLPMSGDVVCRRDGIRPFLFDERGQTPAEDLIPMGPMPGAKMMEATGDVLRAELEALGELSLTSADFLRHAKLTSGTRRRYVEFVSQPQTELLPDGAIQVEFCLPAGSFATTVLAEIAAGTD